MSNVTCASEVVVELDGRSVLDGLSLTIEKGEQVAITGRSGSGKTTLLLVLAGLLQLTGGRVELGVPALDILYVPQAPSLIPELSVVDNASLGMRLRGVAPPEARERSATELHLLGLGEVLTALPSELSGGQQQRVALARATAVRPALLLADEPTGSLDGPTGKKVLHWLRELSAVHQVALVVATHDGEVAAQLPRQVRLAEGRAHEVTR